MNTPHDGTNAATDCTDRADRSIDHLADTTAAGFNSYPGGDVTDALYAIAQVLRSLARAMRGEPEQRR